MTKVLADLGRFGGGEGGVGGRGNLGGPDLDVLEERLGLGGGLAGSGAQRGGLLGEHVCVASLGVQGLHGHRLGGEHLLGGDLHAGPRDERLDDRQERIGRQGRGLVDLGPVDGLRHRSAPQLHGR